MLKFSLKELFSKLSRTFLTAFSIAIAVFSILIIQTIGESGAKLVNSELEDLGLGGFSISKISKSESKKFSNKDLNILKNEEYIESVTPLITATGYLKSDILPQTFLCGIDENAKSIIALKTIEGKKISNADINNEKKVCFIDKNTSQILFNSTKAIDNKIEIFIGKKVVSFTVKGIVEANSSFLQSTISEIIPTVIYIPYTTLQKALGNENIDQLAVNVGAEYFQGSNAADEITNLIKSSLNSTDAEKIKVENLNKQRESLNNVFKTVTDILSFIGGISLVVSGVGITTVMLISISEKRKEIGIKLSVGAKKLDIIAEFIFESIVISLIGCAMGIIITALCIIAINCFFEINLNLSFYKLLYTLSLAVICSACFGIYPAIKAAHLKPVTALSEE